MKKIVVATLAALLVFVLGYWLRVTLASDATKIRWLLDAMKEGFNASSARAVVGGLSKDFVEESTRAERIEIHQFLLYFFQKERDPKTKEFRYQVDIDEPDISVDPDQPRASVRVQANFSVRRGEQLESVWQLEIQGHLEKGEDGWLIVRSSHRTVGGKRPF